MRLRLTVLALAVVGPGVTACRPSDILSVGPPAGVTAAAGLANQTGAEAVYAGAKFRLFYAVAGDYTSGVLTWTDLLTDEFTFSGFSTYQVSDAGVDARESGYGRGYAEPGDQAWTNLLYARSLILIAVPGLELYEPASGQSKVGEAYALAGYAELFLAEDYCAGTPLDQMIPGGGVQYGVPLTTDSLVGVAAGHFDSALAHANGDPTIVGLASMGLGRALLDRGQYAAAASAVAAVPLGFVYNSELAPSWGAVGVYELNMYAYADLYPYGNYRFFSVADVEGENGLNYRSALDPRLTFDSSLTTPDGELWYLPTKFEGNFGYLPLATGVEAALIQAEAALQNGDPTAWSGALNTLRTSAPSTYLALATPMDTLSSDSTTGASAAEQVSVLFRERAFWLFGTGTRLGDLRRLIRQYGRDQTTVFPTGPYANGNNPNLPSPLPTYGTDVDLTLPTSASGTAIANPSYKGCLTSTKTA
jgi:hypothetical protein